MSSTLLPPPREQLCNRSCSNNTHTIRAFVFSSGRGPVPGRIESAGVIRPLIELDVAVHARLSSSESFHSWQWIELVKLEAERLRVVGHGFRGNRDRRVVTVPSPSTAPYFFLFFFGFKGLF